MSLAEQEDIELKKQNSKVMYLYGALFLIIIFIGFVFYFFKKKK